MNDNKMIIKSIELENIRSHKKSSIELPGSSILLAGDIGSGKSSILLALEFALFGFQKGELEGKTLLRHGCNKAKVKIDFVVNNEEVSITRIIEKKKNSFMQTDAWLEMNGKKERLSVEEINNKIVKLLNFPDPKKKNLIYRFTVYTPQEQMKRILLEKPDVRLDIIRKLFAIDKYKRIRENASIYAKELRNEIRAYKNEIKDKEEIKKKIEELEKEISDLQKERKELEAKIKEKNSEKESFEKEIEILKKEFDEYEKKILEINRAKAQLKEKVESLKYIEEELMLIKKETKGMDDEKASEEKARIEKKLNIIEREISEIEKNIKQKTQEKEKSAKLIYLNKNKIETIQKEIDESLKLDVCPRCKQKVSEEHKKEVIAKLEKEIEESKKIIKEEEGRYALLEKEIENLEKLLSEKNKEQRENEKIIREIQLLIERLEDYKRKEKRIEEIKKDIKNIEELLEKSSIDESDYEKKKAILENKTKFLNSILENFFQLKESLARSEEKEKLKKIELEENRKRFAQKEQLERFTKKLESFEAWLSDEFLSVIEKLERAVFFKINREFELLLKRWFSVLVDNIEIRLSDDFTPIIEQNGYENEYAELSGGERTALALAYRLALNQLINSLTNVNTRGLIILDEPTEGFSQKQLERMADIFRELKANQLIIVSHDPKIESFVDTIIRLEKQESITRIHH